MKLLHDAMLRTMADAGMIRPFFEDTDKPVSNGLSAFGYDATLGTHFRSMRLDSTVPVLDPLLLSAREIDELFTDFHAESAVIEPGSYILGYSVEYFRIPDNVLAICLGKSSLARLGVIVNVTPLEPGWEGQVTVEISNHCPYPVRVHSGHGVSQFLFFQNDVPPERAYGARGAKYMGQRGVVLPRFGR